MAQEIYHRSEWGNPTEQWGNVYLNPDLTNELYKRASEYENSWVTDQLLNGVGTKPSIILTPTAYEDGVLNSVKPAKTLGSELVTNGDFDTDSDWGKSFTVTISNGSAHIVSDGSYQYIRQVLVLTVGRKYKVEYEIVENNLGILKMSGSFGANFSPIASTVGFHSFEATALSTTFYIERFSACDIKIDNVSVKEVIDADFTFTRGSSATRVNELGLVQDVQLLSGELVQNGNFEQIGSELVTNGGFDTDSNWIKSSQSSIIDGKARILSTDGSYQFIAQSNLGFSNTQGKIVKITLDIVEYVSGTLKAQFSGGTSYSFPASVGTHTIYVLNDGSTGTFNLARVFGVTDITIDNVSVKEVGQNWTFGTGWSMGDGKVVGDSVSTQFLTQSFTFVSGKKYRTTCTVIGTDTLNNNNSFRLPYDGGVSNIAYATKGVDGIYTHEFVSTGSGTLYVGFIDSGSFTGTIDNISVIEITEDTDLPRINYTNFDYENGEVVPYSGEGSLLLEPQSTNLITYSEDFTQWTTKSGLSIESNTQETLSPQGIYNATKITATTTDPYISYSNVNVTAVTHTASVYVKGVGNSVGKQARILFWYIGTATGPTTSIPFTLTSEWQRVDGSSTPTGAGTLSVRLDFPADTAEVGDVGYLYGFQCEPISYATSYIPTNGSTVTRLADVCNNSGSSDLINSTEGVLYAEISALANYNLDRLISLSNSTTSNVVKIGFLSSATNYTIISEVRSGAVLSAYMTYNFGAVTPTITKIAIKYKENDFSLYVNGVERATDTSGSVPTGLNKLSFDRGDGANDFEGNVKCVAVFKEALSDTELQKLTTI